MGRAVIAIVAVVAVVGLIAFSGGTSASNPPPGPTADEGPKPPVNVVFPVKIVLECEEPTEIVADPRMTVEKTIDPPGFIIKDATGKTANPTVLMQVRQQTEGKLIRFVDIPDEWIEKCYKDGKGKAGKMPGILKYVFDVPRDDTYYVYLRAKWMDSCGNSAWVRMDNDGNDNAWYNLEDENGKSGEKNYKWAWHPLFVEGRLKGFPLKKGQHSLWMDTREDGPWLDQWLVTTEATMPVGDDPVHK